MRFHRLCFIAIAILFGFLGSRNLSAQETTSEHEYSSPFWRRQIHIVEHGESLWGIAAQYDVTINDLMAVNLLRGPTGIFPGNELIIPHQPAGRKSEALGFVTLDENPTNEPTMALQWPAREVYLSQFYHATHHGLDLSLPEGTPILATAHGEVILVDVFHPVYGQTVVIDHGNETLSLYAHLSEIFVLEGYIVLQSEVIGLSGNTGRSTRPHLHFELRQSGRYVNPCPFLPPIPSGSCPSN